jgi:hypothetical protein
MQAGRVPLVPSSATLDPSVEDWVALRTAARWEKKVASFLQTLGVPVFLPMMLRKSVYQSRKRTTEIPVFSGYVFCSGAGFLGNPAVPPACRAKVAQVLKPNNHNQLRQELWNVAGLLADRQLVQERLVGKPGETIRITGGSMEGYEGKIIKLKPHLWQVEIEISMLGIKLLAEVDERIIEKCTPTMPFGRETLDT